MSSAFLRFFALEFGDGIFQKLVQCDSSRFWFCFFRLLRDLLLVEDVEAVVVFNEDAVVFLDLFTKVDSFPGSSSSASEGSF